MRNIIGNRNIKVFVQGSYANNTNVRTESDVDIAIVEENVFRTTYRSGVTDENYNFKVASNPPKLFKDEVQEALTLKFNKDVERKNKSIKVHGNTYRKDADTVPSLRHRDYRLDYYNNPEYYIGGIVILADDGETIINYPEQHIENGRRKNNETNRYYKKMVRIIKKMRYLMQSYGYNSAGLVSSFGLESLLWNIPNSEFTRYSSYRFIFGDVVNYIYNNTAKLSTYMEANGIKVLCPSSADVEKYIAFIKDLYFFYDYDIQEG